MEEPDQPEGMPLEASSELRGVPEQLAGPELPEWLSDQTDIVPSEEESAPAEEEISSVAPGAEGVTDIDDLVTEGSDVAVEATEEEWLTLLQDLSTAGDDLASEDLAIDPDDLTEVEMPGWLQAMEPSDSGKLASMYEGEAAAERSGPLAGLRGVIQIAPAITEPRSAKPKLQVTVPAEQEKQLALLRQLVAAEPVPETDVEQETAIALPDTTRLVVACVLLAVIFAGWFTRPLLDGLLPESALPPATRGAVSAHDAIDAMSGRSAIVAFEYTPAMAGELDSVANTLLEHLAANGSPVLTVSQSTAGLAMAERATEQVDELESVSLGYVPGEAVGLRTLASCLMGQGPCDAAASGTLDLEVTAMLDDVGLIIVLTGERDSLLNWIEQVGTQVDAAMLAGVTQSLGPVVAPYRASAQLSGSVEGVRDAAAYERELRGSQGRASEQFISLVPAQGLVIVALIAGGLYFGLLGAGSKSVGNRIPDDAA